MSSVEDNHHTAARKRREKNKRRPNNVGRGGVDDVHDCDGDDNDNDNVTAEMNKRHQRQRNKTTKALRLFATIVSIVLIIALVVGAGSVISKTNKITNSSNSRSENDYNGNNNSWTPTKNADDGYQKPKRQQQQHPHHLYRPKYFVLSLSSTTTDLIDSGDDQQRQQQQAAQQYYDDALNEESAEVWLHRSFTQDQRLTLDRTMDPTEADVFVVTGLLHLLKHHHSRRKKKATASTTSTSLVAEQYQSIIVDTSKPHLFLVPSWNPKVSRQIGIEDILSRIGQTLANEKLLWSVGFERNPSWQGQVPPSNIIPVPYVVRQQDKVNITTYSSSDRINNFVFYAGDRRKNAESWSGCYRSQLLEPLQRLSTNSNSNAIDVRIVDKKNRMNQTDYNRRMETSDYCLIVCGDTPTSRSLTSAIVSGCIPIRVGSRLRGLCEKPCHVGFGWTVSGSQFPHLPYSETIPWDDFPEVNERAMMMTTTRGGGGKGYDIMTKQVFQVYDDTHKKRLRKIMNDVRDGFIYGYGDPVTSDEFGNASLYIWNSFLRAAGLV
mmetsp:Transcript_3805/g.9103  ORF Transcript_3805/g.9103 Transcript_3805/m.9103 type:complete len:549 (-) Transcript_3805:1596-3242(-)